MHLCNYVHEQKLPPRMNENGFENELKRSIMDLVNARGEALVQFLHLILDKLIRLMVRPPVIGGNIGMLCTWFDWPKRLQLTVGGKRLVKKKHNCNGDLR